MLCLAPLSNASVSLEGPEQSGQELDCFGEVHVPAQPLTSCYPLCVSFYICEMGMLPPSAAGQFRGDEEHKTIGPAPVQSGCATWPLVPLPAALFLRLRMRSASELTVPGPAPPGAGACSHHYGDRFRVPRPLH